MEPKIEWLVCPQSKHWVICTHCKTHLYKITRDTQEYDMITSSLFDRLGPEIPEVTTDYFWEPNCPFDQTPWMTAAGISVTTEAPPAVTEKKRCMFHSYKKYVGFTEVYYYCERCDYKVSSIG